MEARLPSPDHALTAPTAGRDGPPDGRELLVRFLLPGSGPPLRRRDEALLARADSLVVRTGDTALVAYTWGDGPAAFLAHGWASRAAHLAAFIEPLVGAGYRVVTADMPGHGRSRGHLSDLYQFKVALQAIAGEVGEIAAVVAHSGGLLATVMAMVEGLAVGRVVALAPMVRLATAAQGHGPLNGADDEAQAEFLDRMVERYGADLWQRTDAVRLATSLRVPGLVLHDPDDDETPYPEAVELVDAWPGARLVAAPGLGHRRILRHHSSVDAALGFLS